MFWSARGSSGSVGFSCLQAKKEGSENIVQRLLSRPFNGPFKRSSRESMMTTHILQTSKKKHGFRFWAVIMQTLEDGTYIMLKYGQSDLKYDSVNKWLHKCYFIVSPVHALAVYTTTCTRHRATTSHVCNLLVALGLALHCICITCNISQKTKSSTSQKVHSKHGETGCTCSQKYNLTQL